MRFIGYSRAQARECRVEWDVEINVTQEIARALHPHEPDRLQAGRLKRPFRCEPPNPGRRSRRGFIKYPAPPPTEHARGALVFANEDETYVLIEVADPAAQS